MRYVHRINAHMSKWTLLVVLVLYTIDVSSMYTVRLRDICLLFSTRVFFTLPVCISYQYNYYYSICHNYSIPSLTVCAVGQKRWTDFVILDRRACGGLLQWPVGHSVWWRIRLNWCQSHLPTAWLLQLHHVWNSWKFWHRVSIVVISRHAVQVSLALHCVMYMYTLPRFLSLLPALIRFSPASSSTPIWLDTFFCSSSDNSLSDCTISSIGIHNCNHNEDVAVHCLGG